jgi:hypothetical protein
MELAIFVSGAAEMTHNFRPHRALRWDHEAEVVLESFLEQKPAGLSILLGEIRKLLIETHVHLKANFLGEHLRHRAFPPNEILLAGVVEV